MKNAFTQFVRSLKGATAIEYGLIAAGIAVAVAVTVFALGSQLNTFFGDTLMRLIGGG